MDINSKLLHVRTKTEAVYDMLKETIIAGELLPGERIVLRQLAQKLGISGIPIREAIKQLASEGLVTVSPHSEITVTNLSAKEFEELSGIRAVLESYAAGVMTQRQGHSQVIPLQECLNQMELALETNDHRSYGKFDNQFHQIICSNCGNEQLYATIQGLANRTDRARALFIMEPQRMRNSYLEHLDIVEAIKSGDSARVEVAVRSHKENAFSSYYKHQFENLKEDTK